MNNSKLVVENVPLQIEVEQDRSPELRKRETELIRTIEALQEVSSSKAWSSLKTYVFDGLQESLTKEITAEARKENPDTLKLNRLSGELKWAERYADLKKLEQRLRLELTQVRSYLYGKTQERPG